MATIGYRAEIDAGQRFLESIDPGETVVLLFHGDADGCCAGAIAYRTLRQTGKELVFPAFMGKGENLYSDSLIQRVMARNPSRLIVMDMGSRNRAIIPGLTTMVIDHHRPDGVPPVDVFVNSFGVEPLTTSATLTYELCNIMAPFDALEWLAAMGTAGDLGVDHNLELMRNARDTYGAKTIREAVALVNAARRSASHDIAVAFEALITADNPRDISERATPESVVLDRYRREVNAEFKRVLKTAPVFSGKWALIKFSSSCLVHPLIAIAWTHRLNESIVIAANCGYTAGNVHFSVRSAQDIDLLDALKGVGFEGTGMEFAHGHIRATGGILPVERFREFIKRLGFPEEVVSEEEGPSVQITRKAA